MKTMLLRAPGGLDNLHLVDQADPGQPGPGEIRVRVHATSLNFHDYLVAKTPGRAAGELVPMADAGGVVEAVGEGVTQFQAGDHVVSCFFPDWQEGGPTAGDFKRVPGDGLDGYARECVLTPATWFTKAPSGYTHAEAATLTTAGLTAWRALVVDGNLKAGDVVLALGTGGVSIFALQYAKAMGATVVVTSSSDEKLERAKALGADHVVNYRSTPEWGKAIRKWADGGVDHVIEVGGPRTLGQSIQACRVGAHIALIGVLTGAAGDVPTAVLMARQVKLQGLIVGSRRHQQDLVRAIDAMQTKPVIDRTFALDELADAFRYQESGQHFGKICVAW
ncbi:NAD(P)-dependent alcohol dehydrogenase [Verticiella sediminum]|uniref:NAD(P)-dependent alcohol dehydrogenase n=1 Tax=Verticiella sediminum TaxID=1247510 RepID=A0A556B0H3_9BURK|nr:NAD(P)-dependent alcohol dehydrogenase [Verticiella sediminum]TSH98670.1 NAD(P)-dependent alcohol dehydrogenase [Verticiella sediminum]